jgi:hypothetical protein
MQQFQKLDDLTFTEELDANLLRVIRSEAWRRPDRWVRLDLHDLTVRTCSGGNDELVARRLNHFNRLGILRKESKRVNGKRVTGITVPATFIGLARFTDADNAFLRHCGIAVVAEDTPNPTQACGAAPPLDTRGARACAAANG